MVVAPPPHPAGRSTARPAEGLRPVPIEPPFIAVELGLESTLEVGALVDKAAAPPGALRPIWPDDELELALVLRAVLALAERVPPWLFALFPTGGLVCHPVRGLTFYA